MLFGLNIVVEGGVSEPLVGGRQSTFRKDGSGTEFL